MNLGIEYSTLLANLVLTTEGLTLLIAILNMFVNSYILVRIHTMKFKNELQYSKDENEILDTGREIQMVAKYLFYIVSEYYIQISSTLFLNYSPLFRNNSRILTTIKIPKIIPT